MTGFVSLVGAGPGDPELWTVKATRRIAEADVVYYDALADGVSLARMTRAKCFLVGKRAGEKGVCQETIHKLLVRTAKRGKKVVRLKAGDPFVFGRGGEEVEALRAAGLPVAIVPGVTAALGCAASAGIPLTHRKFASAVTFVSGHSAPENEAVNREAAWPALAAQGHTLAIYMGASEAASVRDRLLEAGAHPAMPVAIVENGTRPEERVSTGRLSDLTRLAASHARGDAGPSLIIVGEVAALAAVAQPPLAKVS